MLLNYAVELEKIPDADQVWQKVVSAFEAAGLPHVIYIMSNEDRSRVDLRTNIPQLYDGIDPARDPFLEYCCHSYEATRTGIKYLPDYDYLPPEARSFIEAAGKIGFYSGFGIPSRLTGSTRFGGFNIGTTLPVDAFEARFGEQLPEIRSFCLLVHRRLEEIGETSGRISHLTRREQEVLEHICNGASRKECAKLLDISPNTVAEYTKSAYRKLGVRNRAEARGHLGL